MVARFKIVPSKFTSVLREKGMNLKFIPHGWVDKQMRMKLLDEAGNRIAQVLMSDLLSESSDFYTVKGRCWRRLQNTELRNELKKILPSLFSSYSVLAQESITERNNHIEPICEEFKQFLTQRQKE